MTAKVVALPVKRRKWPAPEGSRQFCSRCDSELFVLLGTGLIHCAGCNALIKNLQVQQR